MCIRCDKFPSITPIQTQHGQWDSTNVVEGLVWQQQECTGIAVGLYWTTECMVDEIAVEKGHSLALSILSKFVSLKHLFNF